MRIPDPPQSLFKSPVLREKHLRAIIGQGNARGDVCARDGETAGERPDQRARAPDPRDHSRPPRQDRATPR